MNRRSLIAWAASLYWIPTGSVASSPDPALKHKLQAALAADSFDDHFAAQVWLTLMSNRMAAFNSNARERLAILSAVHRHASTAALPPEMVLSVMHVESHFRRFAVSSAGAQGLMQIMPFWKQEIGQAQANLFDIDTNVRFGCTILRHYLDRESGRWGPALARYNGSYGQRQYPEKVMSAWDRYWYPG